MAFRKFQMILQGRTLDTQDTPVMLKIIKINDFIFLCYYPLFYVRFI